MGLHIPEKINNQINFFRLHLFVFTFTPLIFSCFFYAANGSAEGNARGTELGIQRVTYVDSLFLCFSAMTVTGMIPVNLSAIHPIQQVLLYILFFMGDYSVVSLVMVLVRKRFFRNRCTQLLQNYQFKRTNTIDPGNHGLLNRTFTFRPGHHHQNVATKIKAALKKGDISTPVDARPMEGFIEEPKQQPIPVLDAGMSPTARPASPVERFTASPEHRFTDSPVDDSHNTSSTAVGSSQANIDNFPRNRTVQIAEQYPRHSTHTTLYGTRQRLRAQSRGMSIAHPVDVPSPSLRDNRAASVSIPSAIPTPVEARHTGMGGFVNPINAIIPAQLQSALRTRISKPERRATLIASSTKAPTDEEAGQDQLRGEVSKWLPKSLGGLAVGRNSRFYTEELDDEELEEIGGVEYRALRLLSYFVGGYIFLCQAIPFAILAIYFASTKHFDSAFQASQGVQAGTVNKTWFSLFIATSAYTGTGMTLVDQSMFPFRNCYLAIWLLSLVLLIGNNALPMTLRFLLWVGTKIWRTGEKNETLHFLLDHPRRCFLYLFPSHQTWFLVAVLIGFSAVEVIGFYLLNIGLPVLQDPDRWELFSDGAFQSLAVRASGFGILPIATFSPALLFLYIILMYVSIYPIAMSVRSTNVYEERALGVYEDHAADEENEPAIQGKDQREVFSKYLFWHMRRQLAFDIWPLGLAIILICICERGKLLDPNKSAWFDIFRIIFECTSAYSTIGLSLGTPANNYSFCAEWSTVSKLVMILIMLRGRHRGLPVAIDRAILLPKEMARLDRQNTESKTD